MKKTVFKALGFVLMIVAMVIINMVVFRSDFPMLWMITALGSVVILIAFPYKKYFNLNSTEK